ncbi:winged helix-turn-helix domain-containing protein [Desulfothermus sp.]
MSRNKIKYNLFSLFFKQKCVKMEYIESIISDPPLMHGFQENAWTVLLITHAAIRDLNIEVSKDTVLRALKEMGYTYKRPAKTVPKTAQSKEEKGAAIRKLVPTCKSNDYLLHPGQEE